MDENPYESPTTENQKKGSPKSWRSFEGWLFLLVLVVAVLYVISKVYVRW